MKMTKIANKRYSYKQIKNILKRKVIDGRLSHLLMYNCTVFNIPDKIDYIFSQSFRHYWWDLFRWFDKRETFFFGFKCGDYIEINRCRFEAFSYGAINVTINQGIILAK